MSPENLYYLGCLAAAGRNLIRCDQSGLARRAGLSKVTYQNFESGKCASHKTCDAVLRALKNMGVKSVIFMKGDSIVSVWVRDVRDAFGA